MAGIRIRQLRLRGVARDYDVVFHRDGQAPLAIAIVTGEISTGKSSVLEFIDYCLGDSEHPQHKEIQRKVRAAMLEVEVGNEVVVIERPLFSSRNVATVHHCPIESLGQPHTTIARPLDPPGDANSLSSYLLGQIGLTGIRLKERPTQAESDTDPLSFRDVMLLCFLPNRQLDNENLLYESVPVKSLKLRQVIELVFGVYEEEVASESTRLTVVRREVERLQTEISSVQGFLTEQGVASAVDLRLEISTLTDRVAGLRTAIARVDDTLRARSQFGDELRAQLAKASGEVREIAARLRDRETLLRRLTPLRAQYADDLMKLGLVSEAKTLFDPLRLSVCPVCQSVLTAAAEIKDGRCSLCRNSVVLRANELDVTREVTATRSKLRELDHYVEEVESVVALLRTAKDQGVRVEGEYQEQVDRAVGQAVAPFLAERDSLVQQRRSSRRETC